MSTEVLSTSACAATVKATGQPCRARPISGTAFCPYHAQTPEMIEARRRGGRLATARKALAKAKADAVRRLGVRGELPDLTSVENCQKYVFSVAARVESRELSPAQANALAGLVKLSKDLIGLALDVKLAAALEDEAR